MAKFNLVGNIEQTLRSWLIGLKNLTVDNIQGYEWEGSIEAGQEVKITHPLKLIPTRFLITDCTGVGTIVRGDVKATDTFFYLKNTATTTTFIGKILIMP